MEDETDLLLFPPLRSAWSLKGRSTRVLLQGGNARRVVFGAMNVKTGKLWLVVRKHQRSEDFQEFLKVLHRAYSGWHIALLLDEDTSHTAFASQDLAEEMKITLLWLPKRSPQLNPLDTLWGQAKDIVSANRQYASIEDHVTRFTDYLRSLSSREILHASGILSGHFWLRHCLSKNFCGLA
ncbi:MAG: transposase [Alphaproteobacteria bacterium]|uniref:Transposase n=1 Tax=Candidatus Nitrobium versatile TaxID=2884831 RepID=A0A953SGX0_9BACT|nr:transposase [Candidatus Nitrobium versatile]